jgi:hypothetical protein
MTVKDLIAYLQTIPEDLPVYATYEGVYSLLCLSDFEVMPEVPSQYSSWDGLPERLEIYAEAV